MSSTTVTPVDVAIATRVDHLAQDFVGLAAALEKDTHFAAQVPPAVILDEFSRFKLWAGNIAAHRKGRRSLEYRLRDAIHLKSETHGQLDALSDALRDALSIVKHEIIPWDELSASDTDSTVSDGERSDADLEEKTELLQLVAGIKSVITSLFRLSIAIRNPAPNSQSTSTISIDKSFYEQHDIQHVAEKFRDAPRYLIERLGRALSARRQYLSYREEHHQKLSKNIEKLGFEKATTEFTTNSTEATRVKQVSGLEVLDEGDDVASQTSYATSHKAAIRVPVLPKAARDKDFFECPLCFLLVSIHTVAEWKQHVFRDLHPYCCTYEHCTIADRLYDSRKAWFAHELGAHRAEWQCIEECGRTFETESDFESHVQKHHLDLAAPSMLSALKRTSIKHATLNAKTDCMLCGQRMTLRALQKHLGRHQQQLALFALPANSGDNGDDEQDVQEDAQGHNDSDPSSKGPVKDSDVDISDASESEQIRPPLARMPDGSLRPAFDDRGCEAEVYKAALDRLSHQDRQSIMLDIQHMISSYSGAVAEEKLGSYDTNAEPSTKSEKTVRENSTEVVSLGERSSITFDPPPSIPPQEIAEPHIADLESKLEKMEDTVVSTEVENVELGERLGAHKESLAGTITDHWRDDTAQGHHTENVSSVDREVDYSPLIAVAGEMGRPEEEEHLDRIEPRVSTLKSRTSDLTRSAAESGRGIQDEEPVEKNRLSHATEYDQAKYLDGGPIPHDSFPNNGSIEALGSDSSDRSDGLLLSPQSQQPILPYTNVAMVIPKASRNEIPPPLPPPRHITERKDPGWQWGTQENTMASYQAEQMREKQLAVISEDTFENGSAVESPHASNIDPKSSAGTSKSTRALSTGPGPTLPSSLADRRQPEDRPRGLRREARTERDSYDDRIVEVQRPRRRRAYSSYHYESDDSGEEKKDNAPKQSGDANRTGTAPTVTSNGHNEIRLKVNPNAPLGLQFNGDMEGRTMQLVPTEDGMAELVITGGRDDESTYYSARESDMGDRQALISREQLEVLIQGQLRGQPRSRRESRVVVDRTDREVEARPRRPSRPRRETRVNPALTDRGEGKSSVEEEGHSRSSE